MNVKAALLNRKSELQIAALIDVVFLLLVYFMVTSALVKKEADLPFCLPVPLVDAVLPEHAVEVLVEVSAPGDILIEGERFPGAAALFQRLETLKAVADASGSELIVSVLPSDHTLHGAVIPVMDACAAAHVKNLSFTANAKHTF